MTADRCPLCKSLDATHSTRISTKDVVELYDVTFSIDIAEEFQEVQHLDYYECNACGLLFFMPQTPAGVGFYKCMRAFDWYYLSEKYEFLYSSQFIPQGARVLDIGCGDGAFARHLPGREYVGLDPFACCCSPSPGEPRLLGMDLEQFAGSLTRPELFDAICTFQCLEHLKSPSDFIHLALSCLKPGGLFIASTPSHDSFLRCVTNSPLALPPHHLTHWPNKTFHSLTRFGLTLHQLHQEPLQDVTLPWFCQMLSLEQLKREPGTTVKGGLIDLSTEFMELQRRAVKMAPSLLRVIEDAAWRPAGHSVIAVYTKTSDPPAEGSDLRVSTPDLRGD